MTPYTKRLAIHSLHESIAVIEALPTVTPCGECKHWAGVPRGLCRRWNAVVPEDVQPHGCDAFEDDGLPF